MKGLFIPDEILKKDGLTTTEKMVLSVYKYYTENGKYKCCSLTCEQVADELNISVVYIKKIKKHLKELGYIRSSGIKVTYLGVKDCTIVQSESVPEYTIVSSKSIPEYPQGIPEYPQEYTIVSSKSIPEYTHKKEERKKEIKKEEKGMMTNFDRLVELLPQDYRTQEKIDYIKDKYEVIINNLEVDSASIDSWVINIKKELNKEYPMEYKTPIKKEEVSDTIDLL